MRGKKSHRFRILAFDIIQLVGYIEDMKKDSGATRKKLIEAGLTEFSTHGMAGARVDRIAQAAGCNKQLIYAYFKNKEGLFAAVYERMVDEIMRAVPFDANDLPGYAARLRALFSERKEVVRMAIWRRLERLTPESAPLREITLAKIAAIEKAQARGKIGKTFSAATLLALVSQLAMTGALATDGPGGSDTAESAEPECIVEAVRRLCKK